MSAVTTERVGRVGYLTLARPETLNALTLPMIEALETGLAGHEADPDVAIIAIRSTSPKAFSAGGDMKHIRELSLAGRHVEAMRFFEIEYALNLHIACASKPYVSLIDGIAMGGGLGLTVHGQFLVVSERAMMAMPETAIGFFPDVGGTHFLPRLPGQAGNWLGLTGMPIRGAEAVVAGLATHCVSTQRWAAMIAALEAVDGGALDSVLAEHAEPVDASLLEDSMAVANRCFGAGDVEAICAALEAHGSKTASVMLGKLRALSPYALDLSLELMDAGRESTLAECLERELVAGAAAIRHPDLVEGIRAVLVDKDRDPNWLPRSS